MKKTYMTPTTYVIRIENTLLQATSPSTPTAGITSGNVGAGSIEGRGGMFDEDEE